ncbi:Peptidase family S41 [Peptoniphilus asaccharolyticus DSM 20463]|uniref:Peptidase family S41 n=1 Tax=Peptoniphilus asaccharolyticus DSM 20463 TaxID=573058 RepID=A0A1W1VJE6_PEPAS|nr:S41 family peptidase [Peptoniphilus asaccharolyticus]MBL7574392.1 S41 family peptidase [Peptoniphilus asaccharolyticus]SMB93403.1 Peptidase family S41 [Peptoniphilus asaccharolyticus DSM 20463]
MKNKLESILAVAGFVLLVTLIFMPSKLLGIFGKVENVIKLSSEYDLSKEDALGGLNQIDKFGLYSIGSKWKDEKEKFKTELENSNDVEKRIEIIGKANKLAGGKHSFLIVGKGTKEKSDGDIGYKYEIRNGVLILKINETKFSYDAEDSAKEIKNYIEDIQNIIYNNQNLSGYIIDLSDNFGGNMYPMLLGLSPLIADGNILEFIDKYENSVGIVKLEDGKILNCSENGENIVNMSSDLYRGKVNKPVAVLISEKTSSSAEMTLLALKTNSRVQVFGKPSAGYNTANYSFDIGKNIGVVLSSAKVKSKDGIVYENEPIKPDVEVNINQGYDTLIKWIREGK